MKSKQTPVRSRNHVTALPDASLGMDIEILVDLKCPNEHGLHGVKTELVASIYYSGYFIKCPQCGAEVRLLRSEFNLKPSVRPNARRTKVPSF